MGRAKRAVSVALAAARRSSHSAPGTSFSVPRSVPAPPSLKNMYKELRAEYGNDFAVPSHGCVSIADAVQADAWLTR
jgi:uracil DNA glycosylase